MFPVNAAFRSRVPLLYLVTDGRGRPDQWLLTHVRKCLDGGVDVVQLRDKTKTDPEFRQLASSLLELTNSYGVPLVINDRVRVAKEINAPSIHVGRKDGELRALTAQLHPDTFVGYSIDADNIDADIPPEADLVGCGPIWATKTKKDAAKVMGCAGLESVVRRSPVPVVAIGGVTRANVADVVRCGAVGAAIIGELMDAEDPVSTARVLKEAMLEEWRRREQHRAP